MAINVAWPLVADPLATGLLIKLICFTHYALTYAKVWQNRSICGWVIAMIPIRYSEGPLFRTYAILTLTRTGHLQNIGLYIIAI